MQNDDSLIATVSKVFFFPDDPQKTLSYIDKGVAFMQQIKDAMAQTDKAIVDLQTSTG